MGFTTNNVYLFKSKSRASLLGSQLLVLILMINVAVANDDSDNKNNFTQNPAYQSFTSEKSRVDDKSRPGNKNSRQQQNFSNVTMHCVVDTVKREDGRTYCNMTFDGLSCWPTTLSGQYAVISCPQDMIGIDWTKNASKFCREGGLWMEMSDYTRCIKPESNGTHIHAQNNEATSFATRVIYNVGFGISTVALVIALFIFLYFRSLRCLRNRIHSHLIVTFILSNTVWFIMELTVEDIVNSDFKWACKVETVFLNYAMVTNFFWMLVEGLYLHIIIVWTYSSDKIKLWYFIIIGWVVPAIVIIVWSAMRAHFDDQITESNDSLYCWLPSHNTSFSDIEDWDYIYTAPVLFVLAVNMLFLASIIWVLVTKLRASHTMESRQLRKAVKATLLLFPLLGITYVIFLWSPTDVPAVVGAHQLVNAFLQSFQGFFVALIYCFLNGEVKGVLKKKFKLMQDSRNLSTRYTKTSIGWANDLSRKESLALANGRISMGYYDNRNISNDRTMDYEREETENML